MKLDLVDTRKIIGINGLRPVTNPILFEAGNIPTTNGLLSTEIFGTNTNDRKLTFAYIDLNDYFIHPYVYKILRRLDRRIVDIVYSSKTYIVDEGGQLVEDVNGGTGLKWLYNNWDKIKFKKNDSTIRNERIALLEAYDKNVLFCKQWIVIPAFYRDVNFQNVDAGKVSHNEITDLYCKLLRFANMLQNTGEFDFMMNSTRGKVQETLVELYDYFKSKLEKKYGLIRKALLGKSIDYGVRAVIAAPEFNTDKYDETIVDFYHSGLPISMICTLFYPFMIHEMRNFYRELYEDLNGSIEDLSEYDKRLQGSAELADFNLTFTESFFKKQMDYFTRSYDGRFNKVEIPLKQEQKVPIYFKIQLEHNGVIETRDLTYTDMLYIVTSRVAEGKHIYITRYPLTNHFGSYPNKFRVLSTHKTVKRSYRGVDYDFYPDVDENMNPNDVAVYFYDVLKPSNLYLTGLGGDYDGDQVTVKGVFSQEANLECDSIIKSKANILDISARNIRKSSNECYQTLYSMTKREEE